MTTVTKQRRTRKPATQRTLNVKPAACGIRQVTITDKGVTKNYWLSEIPTDFGRGFEFERFASEDCEPDERRYHSHLDSEMGHTCSCKAGIYERIDKPCRHLAAVLKLVEIGVLAPVAANHVPAETEQPEYAA